MERVDAGQDFTVVVDYAHKPDAVEAALRALRPLTDGRVIVVLGAGGDRDPGKRPIMAEVAARLADLLVVTDDNPRTEDPAAIRAAMLAGVAARRRGASRSGTARAAIREAVRRAAPGDIVLVAGKGHETGQEIDGVVHPFDDREVVLAAAGRTSGRMIGEAILTAGCDDPPARVRENVAAADAVDGVTERDGGGRRKRAMRAILFGGGLALLISLLGTRVAITQFTKLGYGQEIRDDGPTSHHTKRGTPTMGGVVIILATRRRLLRREPDHPEPSRRRPRCCCSSCSSAWAPSASSTTTSRSSKQRSLGLRSKAKMIGQTVVALVFGALALSPWLEGRERRRRPPRRRSRSCARSDWLALPMVLAVLLIWLIIIAHQQRGEPHRRARRPRDRRLRDGVRRRTCWSTSGRTTSSAAPTRRALCYNVRDPLDLAIVAAAITGACFGFLWWNASPAAIFMGDTGSLSLGGALAGLAILTRTELLLIILGGLFLVETLSVMLQVGYFKLTGGKRIFRMAPLHHHFEMLGWEQVTVVIRFWIITGLCVAAGLGIFYAEWVARL